ncbi:MAG: class I SAM-dependent methyltransferase [Deltaproteobacteria bacterium]|jgi:SAM-dependent methyltransferase|nr:class I SAM-dependent methyltransferase [Deltaproteobacteria bacterium]
MAFNPNQLLNNPSALMALRGAKGQKKEEGESVQKIAPPPFNQGLYKDAFSRLGLLHIANVADLGCGAGNFTSVMVEKNQRPEVYIGVDQSHTQIQIAKQAYPGWHFVYGDFNAAYVRQEYERFEAYLLLNVLDTIEDDLGFLEGITSGKYLVFSYPKAEREGSLRFFPDNYSMRDRYSALLNIRTIGTFRGDNEEYGMVAAVKW